jgi:CreA protein
VKGGLGLAEDRAEASIACRQVGPIRFKGELKDGDEVFKERTSLVFKTMQVVRSTRSATPGVPGLQRPPDRR